MINVMCGFDTTNHEVSIKLLSTVPISGNVMPIKHRVSSGDWWRLFRLGLIIK